MLTYLVKLKTVQFISKTSAIHFVIKLLGLAQGLALQNQETALLSALGKDMAWLQDVMGNPHAMGVAVHCLCEVSP